MEQYERNEEKVSIRSRKVTRKYKEEADVKSGNAREVPEKADAMEQYEKRGEIAP